MSAQASSPKVVPTTSILLAGGDGADRAALAQRKSVAKPRQESGGVEIARSRGVHALGRGHDAHVYDLLALFDQRAFRADLHDGQFAHLRNGLEGVQRLGLAGEGLGLVLVGENDVDVLAQQPAQEFRFSATMLKLARSMATFRPHFLAVRAALRIRSWFCSR